MSLLSIALMIDNMDIAQLLLKREADPDAKINRNATLLLKCAEKGWSDAVSLLLDNKANVNSVDNDGTTPLMAAIKNGWLEVAFLLLDRGADGYAKNINGYTALHYAVLAPYRIIEKLAKDELDTFLLSNPSPEGIDASKAIRLLLDFGTDVNARTVDGYTALHIAAFIGAEDIVRLLLESKANPKTRNKQGRSPLMDAALSRNTNITQMLLDHVADIEKDGPKLMKIFDSDAKNRKMAEDSGIYWMINDAM